jgi:hypothetical protein
VTATHRNDRVKDGAETDAPIGAQERLPAFAVRRRATRGAGAVKKVLIATLVSSTAMR